VQQGLARNTRPPHGSLNLKEFEMTTYQNLLAQKAALEKQAAELDKALNDARRAERAGVIAQVKSLMAEHGLTAADLGSTKAGKAPSASAGRKVAPKYRNQATGETWTGRGLQPKWVQAAVASGKKLEDFTI
jgi:DNA-binding protein H-NS